MKYQIYIKASQTLYLKTLLPIILNYKIQNKFFILSNIKSFFYRFYDISNFIKKNPTKFNLFNKNSLFFVTKIIDVDYSIFENSIKLKFLYFFKIIKKNSILICTTKDLAYAKKNRKKFKKIIIVGYQHMPFIGTYNFSKIYEDKFGLQSNTFFNQNNFYDVLKNINLNKCKFLNLLYENDKYIPSSNKKILVFHPGGYRGVITNNNDNKKVSYEKQNKFFENLLIPLLNEDYSLYIKVHPLAAQFHEYHDIKNIINSNPRISLFENKITILDRFHDYRNIAINSDFNLTFGSSAIYELWSIGAFNSYICTYLNDDRSHKFKIFKDINIDNINHLKKLKKINLNNISRDLSNLINFYYKDYEIKNFNDLAFFLENNING